MEICHASRPLSFYRGSVHVMGNVNPWLINPGWSMVMVPSNNSTWLLKWYFPHYNLVGGLNPSEKYESQLEWLFPSHMEKTCSKPPSSHVYIPLNHHFPMVFPRFSHGFQWWVSFSGMTLMEDHPTSGNCLGLSYQLPEQLYISIVSGD